MELIFHEKQEGSLCAQHCLNALLQGAYFTPVDLATLAKKMDEEERERMAELGMDTIDYQQFIKQPSGNMDDSGYFSVQVISSALEVWGLELVPYNSTESAALVAQDSPQDMNAFICNYRDHWFTIRKIGYQWFNLNSLLSGPELISPTYLSIFLAQLQQEGYSIFIVIGELPACQAEEVLKVTPAVQVIKPKLSVAVSSEEKQLQQAIRLSMGKTSGEDDEESEIQAAIQRSLEDEGPDPTLDKAIKLSLSAASQGASTSSGQTTRVDQPNRTTPNYKPVKKPTSPTAPKSGEDEDELTAAIRLSLQQFGEDKKPSPSLPAVNHGAIGPAPTSSQVQGDEADLAEIRKRRLAFLEGQARR